MHNLDHRLRVLVHKLRLDSQTRGFIPLYHLLQEEELLLQTRILALDLMHIQHIEIHQRDALSLCVQYRPTHKERSGIDTEDAMFISDGVLHSR